MSQFSTKQGVMSFLKENLKNINKTFGIDLKIDTDEEYEKTLYVLDLYESVEEFNKDCGGWSFEKGSRVKRAACIDGAYLFFVKENYGLSLSELR